MTTGTELRALGRYEVVGHLASGGMAEVFLGRIHGPSGFERPVVLKRILPHLARERQFVDMFLDEARIVAQIRHPNVVDVHELVQDGAELFLVMEYLEGESLGSVARRELSRGGLTDPVLAAHMIAEACAGLHAAHELRDADGHPLDLVHRDVSPNNLFVSYSGRVKLLDFGIAKVQDRVARTETGAIKGKLEYMSPEQCQGKPVDRRTDVFSLGVVLYELTTLRRLFKRGTPLHTLEAITREPIVPPSRLVPDYPAKLEAIVLRALCRQREDRYATAAEMREQLALFVRSASEETLVEDAVARHMQELFADRKLEKEEMLRRVRAGSDVTDLPPVEVDDAVDIPIVCSEETGATGVDALTVIVPRRSLRRGPMRVGLALAAAFAGVVLLVLLLSLTLRSPTSPREPMAASAAPSAAPIAPVTNAVDDVVVLSVESRPPGAEIYVDGTLRGTSPAELRLKKGAGTSTLELRRAGYEGATETVSLARDRSLSVTLAAKPAAAPRVAPPRPRPTPAKKDPLSTKW